VQVYNERGLGLVRMNVKHLTPPLQPPRQDSRAADRQRLDTLPMPKLGTDRSTWYESSVGGESMTGLKRITTDPAVMGGKPCIRGLRVTVGTIVGLVATGHPDEEILRLYPYLEADDIREALSYAAWRAEEIEVPLSVP
jgi:uncharacterized protein (DUF433 family)